MSPHTSAPPALKVKTLIIDGKDVSGLEDQTILEVAWEHGIKIPALCRLEGLSGWGGCRICLVEIKGTPKLLPACVTKIQEGMQVVSTSERLKQYRKMVLEMMFVERNHICAVCVSNGHCELQSLGQRHGVDHIHLPYMYPKCAVDATHSRYIVDHNRCILCTRCVRVCDEIEGAHTWDVMHRGITARVTTDLNERWGDSPTCTKCGKCVQVCPTGALLEKGKAVGEMEKRTAFLPYLKLMREEQE